MGAVAKPTGLCQMLALLKARNGCYELFTVEEEPLDCLKRLIVCYYRMDSGIKSGNCRRASLIRGKFRRESVVDCFRYIVSPAAAVAQYRQMVSGAIEAVYAAGGTMEFFSMETLWSDLLVVTELTQTDNLPVYLTNDGTDYCESKNARQAYRAHRRFEDRCLVID